FDPDGARALKDDARGLRVDFHGEIVARQRRSQICDRGAAAPAVADRRLHPRKAVLFLGIVIRVERITRLPRRLDIGIDEGVVVARAARGQWSRAATIFALSAFPILLLLEVWQHVPVR